MAGLRIQTTANSTVSWVREEDASGDPDFLNGANDTTPKPFGRDESIGSIELGEESEELRDFGTRDIDDKLITGYNPSFSIDVVGASWWTLELVVDQFGAPTDNGDGSYTYDSTGDEDPYTGQITVGNTRSGEDYVFEGCRVSSAEISVSAGDSGNPVDVSLNFDAALIRRTEPGTQVTEPAPLEDALSFANVDVDFGRTNDFVLSNLTLNIENNPSGIKQIRNSVSGDGGITDTTFAWGNRMVSVSHTEFRSENSDEAFKRLLEDTNEEDLRANIPDADKPDFTVTISNAAGPGNSGVSGADLNKLVFTFTNMFPDSWSLSGFDEPSSKIEEQLEDTATGAGAISVSYTNGNATKP